MVSRPQPSIEGINGDGVFLVVLIGLILAAAVMVFVWVGEDEMRRDDFLAKCIEFHPISDCQTYWRFDRLDLGERQ